MTLLLAGHALREEEGQELWTQVTDYNQRMSGQWRPVGTVINFPLELVYPLNCCTRVCVFPHLPPPSVDALPVRCAHNTHSHVPSPPPPQLMHYLYDVPTILTHMWRNLFTVQGLVLIYRLHILLIIAIVALYLISPFDLLPEVVLGAVGLLDDVLILTCGLVYITILYRAHVANGNR